MYRKKIRILISVVVSIVVGAWFIFLQLGASEKLTGMLSIASAVRYPVNAYLQVVDQNDQPVSNAIVKIVVAGSGLLAPGTGDGFYHSDANGLIKIEGKGRSIDVQSVLHSDISKYKIFVNGEEYIESLYLSSSGQHAQGKWTDHIHADNPFKIHVWRTQSYDDVDSSYFRVSVPVNDGFYYVSSSRRGEWLATRESGPASILGFSCKRIDAQVDKVSRFDVESWLVDVVVVNGGVKMQVASERYSNLAPADGYEESLRIQSRPDAYFPYQSNGYARAYFSIPEKKLYGAFYFKVYVFENDGESCEIYGDIKYLITGNRNLSVKS